MAETTSLGAAMAAAISLGLWSPDKGAKGEDKTDTFQPKMETQIQFYWHQSQIHNSILLIN